MDLLSICTYRKWSLPQPCVPQPKMGVHQCRLGGPGGDGRGWVLECGVWRATRGRGLLLTMRRQPEEMGVRSPPTRSAHGGSLDLRRSKVPLVSDMQMAGLSSCTSPCLHGHVGGLPLELTCDPPPSLPPPCPYSL